MLEQIPFHFLLLFAGFIGLLVGSFLNVVIQRLPIMLERQWKTECQAFLNPEKAESSADKNNTLNLYVPRSHCLHCQAPIKPWQNIPLISFLLLKGKCSQCKQKISWQYPIIELITALLSILIVFHFGTHWYATIAALAFVWLLIPLSAIDAKHQLIPDNISLPLLWLGLIANSFNLFSSLQDAVYGAIIGYLLFYAIYWIFKLLTGKEGMGYGDFKLLAALGAWLGWQSIPSLILLSSLLGIIVGVIFIISGKQQRGAPIPFGPFLAIAGILVMLYGNDLISYYSSFIN